MANKEDGNGALVNQMEEFPIDEQEIPNGRNSEPKISPTAENGESGNEFSPLHMENEKSAGGWHTDGLKVIIISCIVFSISITVALIITIYYGPPQVSPHGSVSSNSQRCSKIGTDILKDDGSAVDAAIATVFCEGVINSHLTGIGGGGFMVYRNHKARTNHAINFRERSPVKVTAQTYQNNRTMLDDRTIASAGVPGLVKGLQAAHQQFGKKPWRDLIMPAVNLAVNGFEVTTTLAEAFVKLDKSNDLKKHKSFQDVYFINGRIPQIGDTLKLQKLGTLLQEIADIGGDAFYTGEIAKNIVTDVTAHGGHFTIDDFKNYQVELPTLISSKFKGRTLLSLPPPAGGVVVMTTLNVMDLFGVSSSNATSNLTYHRFIEALKFAEKMQEGLADPKFAVEVLNLTSAMINNDTAGAIMKRITDDSTHQASYYGTEGFSESHGTSHISVFGPDEELVSMTTSINFHFGSLHVTENGVLLNNEMADFSLPGDKEPNKNNYIEPGKFPLSSMSPMVAYTDSEPCGHRIAIGGINGKKICAGVAETLMNLLAFEMDVVKAVASPRLYPYIDTDRAKKVLYESGFDLGIVSFLQSLGHNMINATSPPNLVFVAMKVNETVQAASDPRSHSVASVY